MTPELAKRLYDAGFDNIYHDIGGDGYCHKCLKFWTEAGDLPCRPNLDELVWAVSNAINRDETFQLDHYYDGNQWKWAGTILCKNVPAEMYLVFGNTADEAVAELWMKLR